MQTVTPIAIDSIRPGANDRTHFDQTALDELAASIKSQGLLQPITVRPAEGSFEIVAGERRFRACVQAGLQHVPCIVRHLTDEDAAAAMLLENVSRRDLDPIDEGNAYRSRINRFGWTIEDCAKRAGVSTVQVCFRLKLGDLSGEMQSAVRQGILPLGYAQILSYAGLDSEMQMLAFGKLRDNPSPTPAWFRSLCGQIAAAVQQQTMFEVDPSAEWTQGLLVEVEADEEPPLPGEVSAPAIGRSLTEKLRSQIDFWSDAARRWGARGRNFKRDQCLAAATALNDALRAIQPGKAA